MEQGRTFRYIIPLSLSVSLTRSLVVPAQLLQLQLLQRLGGYGMADIESKM